MIANPLRHLAVGRLAENFLLGTPGENFIWLFLVVLVSLLGYYLTISPQKQRKSSKDLAE